MNFTKLASVTAIVIMLAGFTFTKYESHNTEMKEQMTLLKDKFYVAIKECGNWETDYNSLSTSYETLNNKYDTLVSDYNALSTSYSDLKNKYDTLNAAYISLSDSLEYYKDKVSELVAKITLLNTNIENYRLAIAKDKATIAGLEIELANYKKYYEQVLSDIKTYASRIGVTVTDSEGGINTLGALNIIYEKGVSDGKASQLTVDNEALEEEITTLETKLAEKDEELTSLTVAQDKLKAKLKEAEADLQKANEEENEQLQTLKDLNAQLQKELESMSLSPTTVEEEDYGGRE